MQPHFWWECRPAVLTHPGSPGRPLRRDDLTTWWTTVPAGDRRTFHEYVCRGLRSPEALETMERLRDQVAELLAP